MTAEERPVNRLAPTELGGRVAPIHRAAESLSLLGTSAYSRGHDAYLILRGRVKHENSLPRTSASSTSGASSFSRARKWRAGIWLAGNLRVHLAQHESAARDFWYFGTERWKHSTWRCSTTMRQSRLGLARTRCTRSSGNLSGHPLDQEIGETLAAKRVGQGPAEPDFFASNYNT
jgi:hypothetical protein